MATYAAEECVDDWLDSLTLDPDTVAEYRGQAQKWIYPRIGSVKLKDFKAPDAERFFRGLGPLLGKRSLVMIKSTLRRSIRRAQKHDLIAKNVAELVDLPEGRPGRPSRAMTQEQASKLLVTSRQAAAPAGYVKVIRIGEAKTAATHAATEDNQVACGNKPRKNGTATQASTELKDATCRMCRALLGLDGSTDTGQHLEALFVLAITLGLRPGELRALPGTTSTWTEPSSASGALLAGTATPRPRDPGARWSRPGARSMPSASTRGARPPSAKSPDQPGERTTSSSATKTGTSTPATTSTGGSAGWLSGPESATGTPTRDATPPCRS